MDSNTIVMPDHRAEIDGFGNILLWPAESTQGVRVEVEDNQKITTQLVEAALANARLEMDGLILRSALSPAMYVFSLCITARPERFMEGGSSWIMCVVVINEWAPSTQQLIVPHDLCWSRPEYVFPSI